MKIPLLDLTRKYRAIEGEQTALDQKLDQVRKRRMDAWNESYFR